MKVFVAPYGSVIPSDSAVRAVAFTNFRELVSATNDLKPDADFVCLIPSSMEVLRLAIKYSEYFDLEFIAFEGVPGGNYDMMWDQVIYPLEKASFTVFDDSSRHKDTPVTRKSAVSQSRSELARFETERPTRGAPILPPAKGKGDDGADDVEVDQ